MGYEARGKIHTIAETKHVSDRFSKREFVVAIADNPKYPQLVQFQATGDRCAQLDGLHEGDEVELEFSLRGRKWDGPKGTRFFIELDVWKVVPTRIASAPPPPPSVPSSRAVTSGGYGGDVPPPDDSDIPFASCDVAFEPSPIGRLLR